MSNVPQWSVRIDQLRPVGEVLVVRNAGPQASSALFVRVQLKKPLHESVADKSVALAYGTWVIAYLNVCTHMGCELVRGEGGPLPEYDADSPGVVALAPCPCHGTRFDLTLGGLVVLGPATADLPQLKLTLSKGKLVATLTDPSRDPLAEAWPAPAASG